MKKIYLFKTLLLLCALMAGSGSAWAEDPTWSHVFVSSEAISNNAITVDGATWSISTTTGKGSPSISAGNSYSKYGLKFGQNKDNYYSSVTFSTDYFNNYNVKSVSVTILNNASKSGTLTAQQGSTTIGSTSATFGQTWTDLTVNTTAGTGGSLSFTYSVEQAFYINSITVEYTTGPITYSVTYDGNDASSGSVPTDNKAYAANAEVTVLGNTGSLVKTGYAFGGWNTKADGTGTNYSADDTFTISANTTLYAKWDSYTVTTLSNNNSYGTVSVDGYVITASPSAGYTYASTAYTVTTGTATVVQNGNTFTVTPSSDCTVTINFEGKPSHTLSSDVTPANSGSVELGSSSVREGLTTTAEATPKDGYIFKYWSIEGTGASITNTTANPVTVTMGTANATITAHFDAVYTITWSVNGQVVKTMENAEEGTDLSTQFPAVANLGGKTFRGWVTTSNVAADFDEAGLVNTTTATATSNPNYYAVFATGSGVASETATLTAPDNGSSSYENQTFTDDKGNSWSGIVSVSTQDNKRCIQMRTSSSALTSPTFPGTITEIKMLARNGSSKGPRSFYFNSSATSNNGDLGTLEVPAGYKYDSELTATLTGTFSQFYLWVTDNLGFNSIKVTYNIVSYSDYSTSVTVPATITSAEYATFHSDYAVDFSGTGIKAYTATDGESSVTLNEITSGQVPAGTPVVLYKENANGSAINVPVIASAEAITSTNDLSVSTGTDVANMYVLSNGTNGVGFYPWSKNTEDLAAGKVYLQAKASYGSRAFLGFDSEAQGISATLNNNETINNVVFDLQGRRVAKPAKGLYIMDGRKVMVK